MKKIFFALTLCFAMIFGATVSAEESQIDAMQALREAMSANSEEDNRIFHEDLFFAMPSIQGELELIGLPEKNSFKASGTLAFWVTNISGELKAAEIPFYITQTAKDMKIYFQDDKQWYVFQSPSIAAVITDMIATPTAEENEQFIADVKEVNILRDSTNQRTMLIKLDGNKIADDMKAEAEKNPADNGTADDKETQDKFFEYLDTAFRNADIWYMWTIDKNSGKTITLSLHLSGLVQEFARAALADDSLTLDESFKDALASVAFYSDVKSYTNFLNADAKKKVEIPKNVLKAKPAESLAPSKK